MKAAQLMQYGGKEAIAINDVTVPIVTDGRVLIEVRAAGVNPFDWKLQNGFMKDFIPLQLPVTLGGDFSGIVEEVGTDITEFKPGDEIYGQASAVAGNSGSFAQVALTKQEQIALKPKSLSWEQAGALPLVGISAVQAITEHINLQKAQKILIHGGAGGIGSVAIQIAKYLGAHVATTVSRDDMEYAKNLGADEVIDYKSQKFEDIVSEYDAVFDTVGGETAKQSMNVLKSGGILITTVGPVDEVAAKAKNINAMVQSSKVTTERLNRLTELVDGGIVTINVEKTFPLELAGEALDYLKNTPPKGKIAVIIK